MNAMMRLMRKMSRSPQGWQDAWDHFKALELDAVTKTPPDQKVRKFKHVSISNKFRKEDAIRRQMRQTHVAERKKMLESKGVSDTEQRELRLIGNALQNVQAQDRELWLKDKTIEDLEPQYMLIEGVDKLVVLNKIAYLQHMHKHPSGLIMNRFQEEVIENVHYLVNNNLPILRHKVYAIVPQIFVESMQDKIDRENTLFIMEKLQPSKNSLSTFECPKIVDEREMYLYEIQQQVYEIGYNLFDDMNRRLFPFGKYLAKVEKGDTPYYNVEQLFCNLLTDQFEYELLPEEKQLQAVLNQCMKEWGRFLQYRRLKLNQFHEAVHSYQKPPEYMKGNKVLEKQWEKEMNVFLNPLNEDDLLVINDPVRDGGRAYLYERLSKLAREKYDPMFVDLMNKGERNKLTAIRKQLEIQFRKDTAIIVEEYEELLAVDKINQESFQKIDKTAPAIKAPEPVQITLDQLTKALYLSSRNPKKYSLEFFTDFFGFSCVEDAKKLFDSFSYLYLPQQQQVPLELAKYEVLKFGQESVKKL